MLVTNSIWVKLEFFCFSDFEKEKKYLRDHPFKTSACLRGEGVSPCADGQKVTVHKDQRSPSKAFCWNADYWGCENLPTS